MKRTWQLERDPVTGEVDREQAARVFLDMEGACFELGGVFQAAPIRQPKPGGLPGEHETVGYYFAWDSFAPAFAPAEQTPEPESDEPAGAE